MPSPMASLRRRLRMVAVVWLAFQAATLTAFIPLDCCVAHGAVRERRSDVDAGLHTHNSAADCPLHVEHGATCPLHDRRHDDADGRVTIQAGCALTPSALLSVLSYHGVIPPLTEVLADREMRDVTPMPQSLVASWFGPPEPPPPRD